MTTDPNEAEAEAAEAAESERLLADPDADLRALTKTLIRQMSRFGARATSAQQVADGNRRRWRITVALLCLVVGLALVTGGTVWQVHTVQRDRGRDTIVARRAACRGYNQQLLDDLAADDDRGHDDVDAADIAALNLANHLAPKPRTAERQAQVDGFLADAHQGADDHRKVVHLKAVALAAKKHRVCTDAAIAAYYAAPTTTSTTTASAASTTTGKARP